jgi:hypothetical protein
MRWRGKGVSDARVKTSGIHECVGLCEQQLDEIKQRILKARDLASKGKTPEHKQKGEEVVNALK